MNISPRITATGLVTPLDQPGRSTFQAIQAGVSLSDRGIVPESTLSGMLGLCGPVPPGAPEFLTNSNLDKSIRLAYLAALQAIKRAHWHDQLTDPDTALFVGTSKGPILKWLQALEFLHSCAPPESLPPYFAEQITRGPAAIATHLANQLRMTGPRHTSVAACSSGLHALHFARRALAHGECRRALVVAADASVHPFFESSFHRLGILAKPSTDAVGGSVGSSPPARRCRPFAQPFSPAAAGFFLTEAAAALTLEHPDDLPADSFAPNLQNTLIAADSTHLLAIDPSTNSLRQALHQLTHSAAASNFTAAPLSFIHAHATGTEADQHELAALQSIFPNAKLDLPPQNLQHSAFSSQHSPPSPPPLIFSHKSHLGHSLGAAGLVAVVLSALCHRHHTTLLGTPLPRGPVNSITLSQGFGGHIGLALVHG